MVKDYKGDVAVATGEAFDPSPANIESALFAVLWVASNFRFAQEDQGRDRGRQSGLSSR
jgi:hypothetical protein